MELGENAKIIEVIMFIENKPLSAQKIAKMAKIKEEKVIQALSELKQKYDEGGHGIELETSEEGYTFSARKELYERLRKTYGKKVDSRLSRAALETLAIIAYSQGITRPAIDDIRGVSSENIIKLLRERELIKVIGREDGIGKSCKYGTTKKFLYEFNLNSIADLPRLDSQDSERYEEKDDEGNVLTGRLIKKKRGGDGENIENTEPEALLEVEEEKQQ